MSSAEPQQTLEGTLVGHICDRCNRSIQLAETERLYATYYEGEGWLLRRVWCTSVEILESAQERSTRTRWPLR